MRFLVSFEDCGNLPSETGAHLPSETSRSLTDLEIIAETDSTVGDLAAALAARHPGSRSPCPPDATLAIGNATDRMTLPREQLLFDGLLPLGVTVTLVKPPTAIDSLTFPRLRVINGPHRDRTYALLPGTSLVGRDEDADIPIKDELVSRAHAHISVTALMDVTVADINSANGTMVDGTFVSRSSLTPGQLLTIGETTFSLHIPSPPGTEAPPPGTEAPTKRQQDTFIRPPRITAKFAEETHPTPELPKKPKKAHFPVTLLMAPLFMGVTLYALTQRVASLVFVALMPIMMIGMWFENRRSAKKQYEASWQEFRSDLAGLREIISGRQGRERLVRSEEHPSVMKAVNAVEQRSSLLWSRRPDKEHFLQLRLGLGSGTSRVSVAVSSSGSADPVAWNELHTSVQSWGRIADIPVVADLTTCGSLGVAGSTTNRDPVAFGLLLQAVGLHSPHELTVAAFLGHTSVSNWDWLKWLPHTRGENSPISSPLLSSSLGQANVLASDLEQLIHDRQSTSSSSIALPRLLIVTENDCPLDHARLVAIAESGRDCGIHVLWMANTVTDLPATARAFVATEDSGRSRVGFVMDADVIDPVAVERIERDSAILVARSMAPITDAGSRASRSLDLPSTVSYIDLVGPAMADRPDAVTERWLETGSVKRCAVPSARPTTLRALVGSTAMEPCVIDLAMQGPHALVGGTTGSGKSELLQTWVLALANDYSPDRVNFLFVDYKGGAAFSECVNLPHSVGLVTDLTPLLVRRALRSLHAELQRRERVLSVGGAKDIETMERRADRTTPPRLIIVVDEFAALTQEVPEFVDGMVDIAQRGRSLGLHLILATQRPTGVIKDNLRANTNLRIALRMADQADASDVLGVDAAAHFDPEAPGRAAVRVGPGRLTHFQTAYVGGHASESSGKKPALRITEFKLGGNRDRPSQADPPQAHGNDPTQAPQTDLQRLVASIAQASIDNEIAAPTRPWLPELPESLDLDEVVAAAETASATIPFAMSDRPELQKQPIVGFDPDRSGNLVIYGTGGSGKSTTLRSLAMAACLTGDRGPTHVYGLDYGSQGLAMLEQLPHVGAIIAADDAERAQRLIRMLQKLVIDRAANFAAAGVATLPEYRAAVNSDDTPRILLLLDGLAAFRKAHEGSPMPNIYESLLSLAADGRPVGVHIIVTADRPATVPSALASVTPAKLVLRVANENDAMLLNVPRQLFDDRSTPGRGVMNSAEVQVAVLGGSTSVGDQARSVASLCRDMAESWTYSNPESVGRLPDKVDLVDLPHDVGGSPTLGLADESLLPIGYPLGGSFVVTGPPGSGRTTTVATMVRSTLRMNCDVRTVLMSPGVTRLAGQARWDYCAAGNDEVTGLISQLMPTLGTAAADQWLFVIEGVSSFVNSGADLPLQSLVKAARSANHMVVGEDDTQSMQASWPLLLALRGPRRGIVMQPDQSDGDLLFRTPFPRLRRTEFPLGRCLLVGDGRTQRVQVAR